ncbi:MAG: hypothetical protein R2863_03585 [Candidatus Kapaibacterium sp.]|nr:hypothetical protein [Ignavibacteria bacterium]
MKINNKFIFYFLILILMGCNSVNRPKLNDTLLIGNSKNPSFYQIYKELKSYENSDSNFILYTLFYYSIASTRNELPQFVTQYLFIPRSKNNKELNQVEQYFEIYKYTNYQKKVRLNNAQYKEYDNLIKNIKSLILNERIDCDGYSSSNPLLGYYLNFNMFNNEIKINSVANDLLSKNNPISYYCFSSYLRTLLFEKEYRSKIGLEFEEEVLKE